MNVKTSMVWDGFFYLFTLIATITGLKMLWKSVTADNVRPSGIVLVGAMIGGWGLFNFVEGLIDHHILQLHHVVELQGQSVYDYLFLFSGVLFMVIGWLMARPRRVAA